MSFFRTIFNKEKPTPSVSHLTAEQVDDVVKDFLIKGNPNPSNKEIAEKLGIPIEEVNIFRIAPQYSQSHTRYEDTTTHYDRTQLSSTPLKSGDVIKTLQPLQGRSTGGKSKKSLNKNNKKLSRRRRHHSKKNKKLMKRK